VPSALPTLLNIRVGAAVLYLKFDPARVPPEETLDVVAFQAITVVPKSPKLDPAIAVWV
jgi:hypothetical protein